MYFLVVELFPLCAAIAAAVMMFLYIVYVLKHIYTMNIAIGINFRSESRPDRA